MSLLSRINAVCSLCKVNRTFYTSSANFHYLVKPSDSQIPAQTHFEKRYTSIFSIFRRPSIQQLKKKDNIPDMYQLIYQSRLEKYVLGCQLFTTIPACIVGLMTFTIDWPNTVTTLAWQSGAGSVDNELLVFLTVFIGICSLLQFYISRLPVRIYYLPQQKNYIMILYRSIPFLTRRISYPVKHVTKLPPKGSLPWNDCIYEITNIQKVILIDYYFRRPADFNIMLGYQKDDEEE